MRGILSGVVIFSASLAFAGRGYWSGNGPFGASITAIAASPDGKILYVGTQLGEIFRSTDGGSEWKEARPGVGQNSYDSPLSIAVDPTNPAVVFAAEKGVGVFKTTDAGASWALMNSGFTSPPSVCGDIGACSPNVVAVDPSNPSTVMVGTVSGLFRSIDGGENWSLLEPDGYPTDVVQAIVFDPSDPDTIYVGESGGLYKTTDGGASWSPENGGLIEPNVVSLAIDPEDSSILYALDANRGSFRISGGGTTWTAIAAPFDAPLGLAISVDPANHSTLFGLSPDAIYSSPDSGHTWHRVGTGAPSLFDPFQVLLAVGTTPTLLAGTATGLLESSDESGAWISRNEGIREASVSSIAVGPGLQPALYAAVSTGLPTAGWIASRSASAGDWRQLQGTPGGPAASVVIDPLNPMTLYASSGFDFLRSEDGGGTWERRPGSGFGWLAVEPTNPATIYGLPVFEDNGSILRSSDGGNTWVSLPFPFGVSTHPSTPVRVYGIVVDPNRRGRVYVVGDFGIARTTDGGQTWIKVGDSQLQSLALDPQATLTLYAGGRSGLSKSLDGGDSWATLNSSLGFVGALAVDPTNSLVLYAATEAGVEVSRDGGRTWAGLSTALPTTAEVLTLVVDSWGKHLYAGTNQGVYEYDVPPVVIPVPSAARPSIVGRR